MTYNNILRMTASAASTSAEMLLLAVENSSRLSSGNSDYLDSSSASAFAASSTTERNVNDMSLEELLKNEQFRANLSALFPNLSEVVEAKNSSLHQRVPMLLATVTIFYSLIFVAGVLGNLITCIVISRNKFMHTATNYYLFNLAVSDLILLVSGVPRDLYSLWYPNSYPFTDIVCIMESILAETAANATVLTITAFTVERYIAICHPFRQHTMSKLSRAIKFIFAIWVTALLLALPQAMQFSVIRHELNGGNLCTMKNGFVAHVFAVSGFIFFGGPMTAICVLYVLIGVKLKRSRLLQAVPRRTYHEHRGISAQSRVVRMLVAVAVAFFLCWAPFHAQRLMAVYGSTSNVESKLFKDIFAVLDYTSGVLYFLSTCINPLLYNIMSHKFRDAFKVTLARHFGLAGRYQSQSHNYSALLRQNGSMRLHTTDSIRTTTTTTTSVSAGGGGGGSSSCRSSHRNRCISVGSQSTLMTALSKNDVFANAARTGMLEGGAQNPQHRMLQTQISQLSSVGDANSLLDADMSTHYHPHPHTHSVGSAYRLKELRRSLGNNGANGNGSAKQNAEDCLSIDSQEWEANNFELRQRCSDNETDLFTKPVAPVAPHLLAAAKPETLQPMMNSIAELSVVQPSRSRLKLSRIISRRNKDAFVAQASPRVELMRKHLPGMGHIPLATATHEFNLK